MKVQNFKKISGMLRIRSDFTKNQNIDIKLSK